MMACGACLDVLARGDPPLLLAVKLSDGREDDGLGRHVEAHGKGLRCEQALHTEPQWVHPLEGAELQDKLEREVDQWGPCHSGYAVDMWNSMHAGFGICSLHLQLPQTQIGQFGKQGSTCAGDVP